MTWLGGYHGRRFSPLTYNQTIMDAVDTSKPWDEWIPKGYRFYMNTQKREVVSKLAGTKFENLDGTKRQDFLEELVKIKEIEDDDIDAMATRIYVEFEPNRFDDNAVVVGAILNSRNLVLGYLPKELSAMIYSQISDMYVKNWSIIGKKSNRGMIIRLCMRSKQDESSGKMVEKTKKIRSRLAFSSIEEARMALQRRVVKRSKNVRKTD